MKKIAVLSIVLALITLLASTIGASVYMLHYSLDPDPNRADTTACFGKQFDRYPETREWVDSLRHVGALRDTFVTMPTRERHHALYISIGSNKTALLLHGWRNCAIDMLFMGRVYDREIGGYNVVIPDFHAHGLSEGGMVQMGWLDRKDMEHWMALFQTDTMVIHGVSMGGATAMMMSAMTLPKGIKDIRFIDDCGYTSVWDEFSRELKNQFGLPEFPLMHIANALCKLFYGWSFDEASAIGEVSRCVHPMLFIHGSDDDFVPTEMVHRLYAAKAANKQLWIADKATHARSYQVHKAEYIRHLRDFLNQ